jgi:dUTP pyrophosphatase
MTIRWKKLREDAVIPERATALSAGFDLSAAIDEDIILAPGEIKLIGTGLSAQLPEGQYALMIYARSGLAAKHGIGLANSVGVVDSDYRGEIKAALINQGREPFKIEKNMRIAQAVLTPVVFAESIEAERLSETERGSGGFGSTGR